MQRCSAPLLAFSEAERKTGWLGFDSRVQLRTRGAQISVSVHVAINSRPNVTKTKLALICAVNK